MPVHRIVRSISALLMATAAAACGTEVSDLEGRWEEGPPLLDAAGKADGVELPAYGPLPEAADLDRALEALFTPDDPVVTLELAMIERVRTARRADAGTYADGANPFRIRYAVYNLRNPQVTGGLIAAADDGVDVQVLIEADQLDPARDYNLMDERLVQAGFEFAPDHRGLDEAGRASADLVGVTGSGLMHLKTRLFETPGWSALLTGSMNPGDNAVMNEETLHLVRDPEIIASYGAAYEAVLNGRRIDNRWRDDAVNVLFTPGGDGPRAGAKILEWVAGEDEQILLMVYSLRDVWGELVTLLRAKVASGVPVYVITDRKQSDGVDADGVHVTWDDHTEDRLREAGVHVYEATNRSTPYTAMHHKVAILGLTDIRIITDAGNWTVAGLGRRTQRARNQESLLFVDCSRLDGGRTGRRYLAQWLRVLSRYAHQSAGDAEPTFDEVAGALMASPDWPLQEVAFEAIVETEWGEEARVRGSHEALGSWGYANEGLPLTTEPESYPVWRSPDPALLPLGLGFDWKLVVVRPGTGLVRWEEGQDRRGLAQPGVLEPGAPVLRARYR